MVTDIGVCEPRELSTFPEVYAIYKENKTGMPFRKTDKWRTFLKGKLAADSPPRDPNAYKGGPPPKWEIRPHGDFAISPDSRKVKGVGVWDTVGALGVPDLRGWNMSWLRTSHGFHNVHLNKRESHYLCDPDQPDFLIRGYPRYRERFPRPGPRRAADGLRANCVVPSPKIHKGEGAQG